MGRQLAPPEQEELPDSPSSLPPPRRPKWTFQVLLFVLLLLPVGREIRKWEKKKRVRLR